ncbi:GUN4 domain-containing protein [Gloeocapsa sp. PCC 73106]|uniref:GUN4 domain-containing protein n=1 Tax=Gloeocapsa sp. PCC 73106 TaxID=102232 RepID=UPI0002ABD172|nr:GUN4 domain-containing protein [Gloeocapsa sp. PCC 73106]ELR99363.1 GUN4 [Gloeocapsa sp. PCC 73106]
MKRLIIALALLFVPVTSGLAQDNLVSPETGISYDRLADLLAREQWRQANDQTFDLLLQVSGRNAQGWMDLESFKTLACADLQIMDRLWTESSGGHFGFSVQLPIFLETGNKPGRLIDDGAFDLFGDQIGWRKDSDWVVFKENLVFSLEAPEGHLPNPRQQYEVGGNRLQFTTFAQRLVECEIVKSAN